MKIVFLDRDGVINVSPKEKRYVTSAAEFRFLPKVKAALALLFKNNYRVFVISNQAGVGRGVFSQDSLDGVTAHMKREVFKHQGFIEDVFYCTHHPGENCACRKPKAGLINKAKKKYALKLSKAYFVGDTVRDITAAHASGCRSIMVLSGKEKFKNKASWEEQPEYIFKNLFEAARFIVKNP